LKIEYTPRLIPAKSKNIISNDTALRELLKLRSLGLVEQKGIGRGTYYTIK
jgi:Fic family protein